MASRYSLHIGVSKYAGTADGAFPKDLANAANDAQTMYQYCRFLEFFTKSTLLLNEQVDLGSTIDGLYYYSQICRPGDLFVLTYAGHGQLVSGDVERIKSLSRNYRDELKLSHGEPGMLKYDKKKREWVLESAADTAWLINNTDRFYDNLLTLMIKCFEPGVRILSINDSCNNASMIDTHNLSLSDNAIKELESNCLASQFARSSTVNSTKIQNIFVKLRQVNKQKMKQGVISMSSVWEMDAARDAGYLNKNNGLYTANLMKVLIDESPQTYFELHSKVHDYVKKELNDYYDGLSFANKFYTAKLKNLSATDKATVSSPGLTNPQFYAIVEKYLDQSDKDLYLPSSLTGNARYLKIEQLFQPKWRHYQMRTVNRLAPYMIEDLADEFTPGFTKMRPFKTF